MATRKLIWVFFGTLVISAWVLRSAMQMGAETMNIKSYSYVVKAEEVLIGDVEDHIVSLDIRSRV